MDLDVLFLGTAGSSPSPRRGLPATLRAPGRRPAADRLRRGHAATAHALRRAGRARGAVHHPLPRRSRAGAARNAEDLRAAPARASAHGVRAARTRSTVPDPLARDRPAHLRGRARGARTERPAGARRLPHRGVRGRPRRPRSRLRARRGAASGRVRPGARARAGRDARPGLRPAPGRRGRERRSARSGDGGGARRAHRRVERRHHALRHDSARRLGGRPARPRGHLHGGGRRARRGDAPLDRRRGGRDRRGGGGAHARADAHLSALLGRPGEGRGARDLRKRGRAP